jgi:hypothetical protein
MVCQYIILRHEQVIEIIQSLPLIRLFPLVIKEKWMSQKISGDDLVLLFFL